MISSPPSFPCSSTEPDETRAELTARFVRDAVPMRDQLYGRAARLTGNRVDAEDLLQETMLRAYASFSSFRQRHQPQEHGCNRSWPTRGYPSTAPAQRRPL